MVTINPVQLISKQAEGTGEAGLSTAEAHERDINKVLENYREWILMLARKQVSRHLISTDEVDDLLQTALITFWLKLTSEKRQITSPRAYIASIVYSRSIDMMRQRQKCPFVQPLSIDQIDESYQSDPLPTWSDEKQNPALEYEYKELLGQVAEMILKLSPCQQRAMICMLKDEVADTSLLAEILGKHGIDIDAVHWPQDSDALQSLRSSLSLVRRKFRACRNEFALVG